MERAGNIIAETEQIKNGNYREQRGNLMKWPLVPISVIADVNPRNRDWAALSDETEVTFVPMPAVSEDTASIISPEIRLLKEVRRGYTPFRDRDVRA